MRKDTRNSGFAGSGAQAEFRWWAGGAGLFSCSNSQHAMLFHARGDNEFYDVALQRGVSL